MTAFKIFIMRIRFGRRGWGVWRMEPAQHEQVEKKYQNLGKKKEKKRRIIIIIIAPILGRAITFA